MVYERMVAAKAFKLPASIPLAYRYEIAKRVQSGSGVPARLQHDERVGTECSWQDAIKIGLVSIFFFFF